MDERSRPRNGTEQTDNLAIVDCMMNLSLLYWASIETGEWNIATSPCAMRNVLKYFIRSDNSLWHAYRLIRKPVCPLAPELLWPGRGFLWARGRRGRSMALP